MHPWERTRSEQVLATMAAGRNKRGADRRQGSSAARRSDTTPRHRPEASHNASHPKRRTSGRNDALFLSGVVTTPSGSSH